MASAAETEFRAALGPHLADAAAFDGWTDEAVTAAAEAAGIDPAAARFVLGNKPMAMIEAWTLAIDTAMASAWPAERLAPLKIRERIRVLIESRIDAISGNEEALRRALIEFARPANAAATARLAWRSADAIWRLAGDTATDLNHYTKRLTLGAVYASTLAVLADDRSEGHAETRAFLGRRIDGIMRFEKAKARLFKRDREGFSLTRLAGRLRYPGA